MGERGIEREPEQQEQIRLVSTLLSKGPCTEESRRGGVVRGAGFEVAAPWGCGMEHRRRREVELRRRCDAMSVQPLWWHRVGVSFVRGVGEDVAVLVEQVKAVLCRWSGSLEVEDGAAKPAGQRGVRRILIREGG